MVGAAQFAHRHECVVEPGPGKKIETHSHPESRKPVKLAAVSGGTDFLGGLGKVTHPEKSGFVQIELSAESQGSFLIVDGVAQIGREGQGSGQLVRETREQSAWKIGRVIFR